MCFLGGTDPNRIPFVLRHILAFLSSKPMILPNFAAFAVLLKGVDVLFWTGINREDHVIFLHNSLTMCVGNI